MLLPEAQGENVSLPFSSSRGHRIPWFTSPAALCLQIHLTPTHVSALIITTPSLTLTRRRQWHPTPVLLPGKSRGRGSLAGCHLWGHTESDMTERLHFHFSLTLEKEMATHSSVLAWRIPGTGEPGGLPSMGSRRVGHD